MTKVNWAEHAGGDKPKEQLDIIGELASEMLALEDKIEAKQEELKELNKQYNAINQGSLPEALQSIGLLEIKHVSGRKLSIKTFYQAKISDGNKFKAFEYLTETGNDSLIKTDVTAKFGKGELEKAKEAADALEKMGIICGMKTGVHPSTLKAFVKEQIESGVEGFPTDLFGVFVGNKIVVK